MAHSDPDATYAIAALTLFAEIDHMRIHAGLAKLIAAAPEGEDHDTLRAVQDMALEIEGIVGEFEGIPSALDLDRNPAGHALIDWNIFHKRWAARSL